MSSDSIEIIVDENSPPPKKKRMHSPETREKMRQSQLALLAPEDRASNRPPKPIDPNKKQRRKPVPPPPPKGNKYALGNKGGRPAIWDPVVEAQALLEWLEKPSSLIINEFVSERGFSLQRCDEWVDKCHEFKEAYEKTKLTIAFRRESLALRGKIKEGVYNRYQAMYDSRLHKFERAEKAYDASLKAGNTESTGNLVQLLQMYKDGKITAEDLSKLLPDSSLTQKPDGSDK